MNKKIKRDVTYMSIITFLVMIIVLLLSIMFTHNGQMILKQIKHNKVDVINMVVKDSLVSYEKERLNRHNADMDEAGVFLWSKAEADTIYFRKARNILEWQEIELNKIDGFLR